MKKTVFLTALALLSTSFASAEMRKWTSAQGSTIEAELVDYSDRVVVLRSAEGRKISLRLNQLSPSDQAFILAGKKKDATPAVRNVAQLKPGLAEMLPQEILDSAGNKVPRDELAGKMVGFYFSAHWCPPCRGFTPNLVKFRDSNNEDFEVVFVSSDKSPEAQMGYMKETGMKWYTLPHRSSDANALSQKFGIRGIPALIIVSPDGKTITKEGRRDVSSNPGGAIETWSKSS